MREQFKKEYQGSLHRLESNIEEEYIMVMRQNCLRERSYRKCSKSCSSFFYPRKLLEISQLRHFKFFSGELMMTRARSFGNEAQLEQAKALKVTSCDNLARLGLTKYILN